MDFLVLGLDLLLGVQHLVLLGAELDHQLPPLVLPAVLRPTIPAERPRRVVVLGHAKGRRGGARRVVVHRRLAHAHRDVLDAVLQAILLDDKALLDRDARPAAAAILLIR